MKIEIDYFSYDDKSIPCGATTGYEGMRINGFGSTWEEAKEKLLEKLKAKLSVTVPKREIVELPESEPEPDFPDRRVPEQSSDNMSPEAKP